MYHIFNIHSSIDWYLELFCFLALVNRGTMNMDVQCLYGGVDSPVSTCPRESWLSHMVGPVLVFWGTSRVASKVDALVYNPTSDV